MGRVKNAFVNGQTNKQKRDIVKESIRKLDQSIKCRRIINLLLSIDKLLFSVLWTWSTYGNGLCHATGVTKMERRRNEEEEEANGTVFNNFCFARLNWTENFFFFFNFECALRARAQFNSNRFLHGKHAIYSERETRVCVYALLANGNYSFSNMLNGDCVFAVGFCHTMTFRWPNNTQKWLSTLDEQYPIIICNK